MVHWQRSRIKKIIIHDNSDLMRDDNINVEGKVVMTVIENIITMSKHICWVPTKMPILEEWRSFLKGLGDAEGLEIDFDPTSVQTDLQAEKSKSLSF